MLVESVGFHHTYLPLAGHSHGNVHLFIGKYFLSLLNEDKKLKRESPTLLSVFLMQRSQ